MQHGRSNEGLAKLLSYYSLFLKLTKSVFTMALIKTSALVSDISGKIGGNVFARNSGGSYVRSFTKPVNPNTPAQQAQKNRLAYVSNAWRELTDAQRQAWTDAAKLSYRQVVNRMGETVSLTGFGYYMKANMLLQTIGQPLSEVPGTPITYPGFKDVTLTYDGPTETYTLTAELDDITRFDNGTLNLSVAVTPAIPSGQKIRKFRNFFFANDASTNVTVTGEVVDMTFTVAELEGLVGSMDTGSQFGIKIVPIDTQDPWDTIDENFAFASSH